MLQDTAATAAQTQQWRFILQQLFAWVMAGLAWIVPFQAKVIGFVLRGESFWSLAGTAILLLLPAAVFIAGIWGTMVSLYTIPFRLGRSVTLLQKSVLLEIERGLVSESECAYAASAQEEAGSVSQLR